MIITKYILSNEMKLILHHSNTSINFKEQFFVGESLGMSIILIYALKIILKQLARYETSNIIICIFF